MRKYYLVTFIFLSLTSHISSQNFWQQTNGPYGGIITTLKFISNDSILVGTQNGIYVSSDFGENWYNYDENLNYKSIRVIENYLDEFLIIIDNALVKTAASSYDTIFFTNEQPATVAVNNSGNIFLGTAYNIYSSTNLGASWISLEDSTMNINYSNEILIKNDTIIFYAEGNRIYRSFNDGQTWVKINESFQNVAVSTIYLDVEGNLYASNSIVKLVKSTDNGDTWENIANNYLGYSVTSIVRDSADIYVGTSGGIYKSTNDGNSWFYYSNGLITKQVSCLRKCAGKIVVGTYGGGVYILDDNSNEWEFKAVGIDATSITDIIVDSENNVLAGTDGMGIHRIFTEDPIKWEMKNNGLNDLFVNSLAISKYPISYDHIYLGTRFGAFKTSNLGDNWISISSPCYNDVYGICVNNTGSIFIWTYCGIFRTTNDGISWDLMNSNNWSYVRSIAAEPNQSNVYVSAEYDFYRTTDNGVSWTHLLFYGRSARRIGISSQGHIYILRRSGEILRSTNFGNSFQNINNGLPTEFAFMHDIAFNSEDDIYLATRNGLYMSANEGNSWYLVDESNISKHINVLAFDNENRLYAGTTESGVYRSVELLTNLNEKDVITKNYFLSQN
jgi:photosystem II stability/assembly factor-like uncharacterized protein